ncbi:hypothetical protein CDAR_387011 [Caerostris darwini]|uniref:Uncharacterized protein n=1 Tax=Caerostris darwini TaxID=1538125 RepID=A0AAV4UMJ0_9ARAC|nr:hypothetical protein CDAR_387011 [Caerostris darwini]
MSIIFRTFPRYKTLSETAWRDGKSAGASTAAKASPSASGRRRRRTSTGMSPGAAASASPPPCPSSTARPLSPRSTGSRTTSRPPDSLPMKDDVV